MKIMKRLLALLAVLAMVIPMTAVAEEDILSADIDEEIIELIDEDDEVFMSEDDEDEPIDTDIEQPGHDMQKIVSGEFNKSSITVGKGEQYFFLYGGISDGIDEDSMNVLAPVNQKMIYFGEAVLVASNIVAVPFTGLKPGTVKLTLVNKNYGTEQVNLKKIPKSVILDTMKITVKNAPKKVTLPKTAKVVVGAPKKLKAKVNSGAASAMNTWTSSDPTVATVEDDGTVTALRAGTTVITVETYNGKTASCTVTVPNKVDGLTPKPTKEQIKSIPAGYFAWGLKSVEIVSPTKVVAEWYVANNAINAKTLRDSEFNITINGIVCCDKKVSKMSAKVSKGSCKTIKVTFTGENIVKDLTGVDITAAVSVDGAMLSGKLYNK